MLDGPYIVIVHTEKVTVYTVNGITSCKPIAIFRLSTDSIVLCTPSSHLIWSTELNCMDVYLSLRFSTIGMESPNLYVEWATIYQTPVVTEGTTCSTYLGKLYDVVMPSHNADIPIETNYKAGHILQQLQLQWVFHSGLIGHIQYDQCWAIAYSTISFQYTQSNNASEVHSLRSQLTMVLTINSELVCLIDGHKKYSRALPLPLSLPRYTTQSLHGNIHLHLTTSAHAPLLLISTSDRVLLCDALYNGTVLREFIHIGAYICAPLLDGLEEQLLIFPNEQVEAMELSSIRSGWVSNKSSQHKISDKSSSSSSSSSSSKDCMDNIERPEDLGVNNWFLYELPYQRSGDNEATVSICCNSMDPHGLWRSGE